jgi:hypothetical protein
MNPEERKKFLSKKRKQELKKEREAKGTDKYQN